MGMSAEEKFLFDLNGYIVRPAVLTEDEVAEMKEQAIRIVQDPKSLPREHRSPPGGAFERLLDHPRILEVLHEVIGPNLRVNSSILFYREKGEGSPLPLHQGGSVTADPMFGYRVQDGRIYAGMVRVVIELNEVRDGDGGTVFIPGSHKSQFPVHESHGGNNTSPFLRGYSCPPGSVLFFTEQVAHKGPVWQGDEPRIAVFNAYTHVAISHHLHPMSSAVISSLAPERQAFFALPWELDFREYRGGDQPVHFNTAERHVATGARHVYEYLEKLAPLSGDGPSAS